MRVFAARAVISSQLSCNRMRVEKTLMQTLASQLSCKLSLLNSRANSRFSALVQTLASQLSCKLSLLNSHANSRFSTLMQTLASQLSCKLSFSFDQSFRRVRPVLVSQVKDTDRCTANEVRCATGL
jgi:hypothetical protein